MHKKLVTKTLSHRWFSKKNKLATFLRRYGFSPLS